jgi:hypothetical protein
MELAWREMSQNERDEANARSAAEDDAKRRDGARHAATGGGYGVRWSDQWETWVVDHGYYSQPDTREREPRWVLEWSDERTARWLWANRHEVNDLLRDALGADAVDPGVRISLDPRDMVVYDYDSGTGIGRLGRAASAAAGER